ncbi:hypothetical protein BIV01_11610 [Curtobacterium sp. MCBA15_013]|nr:hypothetical protein BIV01_11610 [Curtobacterium sp. MCBA15_013]
MRATSHVGAALAAAGDRRRRRGHGADGKRGDGGHRASPSVVRAWRGSRAQRARLRAVRPVRRRTVNMNSHDDAALAAACDRRRRRDLVTTDGTRGAVPPRAFRPPSVRS